METIIRKMDRVESSTAKKNKPVIITWKNAKLLRSQSINIAIDNIYESSKSMEFIKINLIGASSSGKTTLGEVLAHGLHERDPTFEVHFFKDEDLIDFRATITKLSKNSQILVFDDLSGLVAKHGKKKLDILKAELTEIRHIDPHADRKIIMILNFHAQKTLDKFIRISNFTFYTDCQNEEVGYLEELLGKYQKTKILQFAKLRASARMYHKFNFPLSGKNYFTYKDGDPFRLLLYNNGMHTNFIVSPQLSWILDGKNCSVCNPEGKTEETKENLENFVADYSKKFGQSTAKRAVVSTLQRQGLNVMPKRVVQAERYIGQYIAERKINLDELATQFNLQEKSTRLPSVKQPDYEVKAE
jgi:hypothetical protein